MFLPWHRPYVLLFEQVLVAEAQKIAATYPDSVRSQYVDAANTLRAPFWDWSRDSNVPPCSVPATLTVNIPDGENLTATRIKNPLQTYTYPRKARSGQFGPFTRSPTTSRCPAPNSYPYTANRRLGQLGLKQETVSYHAKIFSSCDVDWTIVLMDQCSMTPSRTLGLSTSLPTVVKMALVWSKSTIPFISMLDAVANSLTPMLQRSTVYCKLPANTRIPRLCVYLFCHDTFAYQVQ